MRIKHWQGYGFIQAENLGMRDNCIKIRVTGEHEYGLDRSDDTYDCVNWLLHKFRPYKDITERDIAKVQYVEMDWNQGVYMIYLREKDGRY